MLTTDELAFLKETLFWIMIGYGAFCVTVIAVAGWIVYRVWKK